MDKQQGQRGVGGMQDAPAKRPITVLLVEDHVVMREGLLALLTLEGDLRVIGEAGNGRKAVELASKLCPDVVVMDLMMPLLDGIAATRLILQVMPGTKVLILSVDGHDAYRQRARAAGASGYLVKQTDIALLPHAIREVHGGKTFFGSNGAKR